MPYYSVSSAALSSSPDSAARRESVFQRRGHGDAHNAEIFDDTHAVICAEKENDRRARNARRAREQVHLVGDQHDEQIAPFLNRP